MKYQRNEGEKMSAEVLQVKGIADQHGMYPSGVAGEIDQWLRGASDSTDPAMTIMCILYE